MKNVFATFGDFRNVRRQMTAWGVNRVVYTLRITGNFNTNANKILLTFNTDKPLIIYITTQIEKHRFVKKKSRKNCIKYLTFPSSPQLEYRTRERGNRGEEVRVGIYNGTRESIISDQRSIAFLFKWNAINACGSYQNFALISQYFQLKTDQFRLTVA